MTDLNLPDLAEDRWHQLAHFHRWLLPQQVSSFMRMPVIRLMRYCYRYVEEEVLHIGSNGLVASDYQRWVRYAIYRGWC
jgi:hypothetical protein